MNQLSAASFSPAVTTVTTPLRKLIRYKSTGAFLGIDGTWTQDIAKALAVAEHSGLEGVRAQFDPQQFELYYSFEHDGISQFDFTLSL